MNQEAHLDSFTVCSLTKQNKKTSPLPLTVLIKVQLLPTQTLSSSISLQVNTEKPNS